MQTWRNDTLQMLLFERAEPPSQAELKTLINDGYVHRNVGGLAVVLEHFQVDQAVLVKYCERAQGDPDRRYRKLLCTNQPWLIPDVKEPE
jgi:hypothetical protein